MKILLVYPNISKAVTPQMGILSLGSYLLSKGIETQVCDLTFVNPKQYTQYLYKHIEKMKPGLIGISCRTMEYPLVKNLLIEIKKYYPNILTVAGGPHITFAPNKVIDISDYLVIGEGEEAMYEIAMCINDGRKKDINDIHNVMFSKNGTVKKNNVRPLIELSKLPFPRYELFDKRHYYAHSFLSIVPSATVCGVFEGSRGCPYTCTYCSNGKLMNIYQGKGKWRREKSYSRLRQEMDIFQKNYGLDMAYFIDEVIMTSDKRTEEMKQNLEGLNVPFVFMERPELVTEKRVRDVKAAGAYSCSVGIESGNQAFRERLLKRKMSDDKIKAAYQLMKKHGIKTHAFTMFGLPDQTRKIMYETYKLIEEIQPDSAQATTFFPLPGTELYEVAKGKELLKKDVYPTTYYRKSVLEYSPRHKAYISKLTHLVNSGLWRKSKTNKIIFFICLYIPMCSGLIYYAKILKTSISSIGFRQTMQKIIIRITQEYKMKTQNNIDGPLK